MCEGCIHPVVAFSWLGGILINSSVVALISWSALASWPIGFALAALYAIGLFAVAVHLQSRPNPNRLPIDLLLLLGVGAVGACGSIISFNVLFGCSAQSDVGRASSTWTFPFNASRGSADVLAWAALDRYSSGQRASFAYEPTSSSLFFAGRFGDDTETLWLKRADDPLPVQMDGNLTAPQSLVAVGRHVCFSAFDLRRGYARKVYCCVADGSACAAISIEASLGASMDSGDTDDVVGDTDDVMVDTDDVVGDMDGLLVSGADELYFKASAPFGLSPASGVVYRAHPPFLTATLLSVPSVPALPSPAGPPPPSYCDDAVRGLLSTIPALVATFLVWKQLHAPSMALAAFLSLSALATNSYLLLADARAGSVEAADFLLWWLCLFGAAWLLLFAALKLQNRVDDGTFRWGIDAGVLAYVLSCHSLLHVPFTNNATAWLAYQVLVLVPLLLLALVSARTTAGLPLFFASTALLIDAYKVTDAVAALVDDPTMQMLLTFVTLGVVGVGVVVAGLSYTKYQEEVGAAVDRFAECACGPCMQEKAPESLHSVRAFRRLASP